MLLPQEIIRAKRDGHALAEPEIRAFVAGLSGGGWSEGQAAALAMAILLKGMTATETATLTRAMAESGTRLAWDDLPGPVVDKHSTGGIGDKVSLILAPILAACGCFVPMLSGRGLGHTGGTLDKLDSIPGYRSDVSIEVLRQAVRTTGLAIVGATHDLAPADRRLYAIRDVTATVESIPLITASILAKKLAAGPHHLVMDVKTGSGAFLPDPAEARALARSLVDVANAAGLPTRALVTDMAMCLGRTAGNAVEVVECLDVLRGRITAGRLVELTLALAAELLDMAGIPDGAARAAAALADGSAAERFARMVRALGGPHDLLDRPERHLPKAPLVRPVRPDRPGMVAAIDARRLGLAILTLGGGRSRPDATIDHTVGLSEVAEPGEPVAADRPLCLVHAHDEATFDEATAVIRQAFTLAASASPPGPVVLDRIG